jgi:hypothetical protein
MLLHLGTQPARAQAPAVMSQEACLAATENFIALMQPDPSWQHHVSKPGQIELMRSQARARCSKPIEPTDQAALECMAIASEMAQVQTCLGPMLQALSAPLSQAHCLKVQVHLYQVMLANPDISSKERQALKAAREAHGPESDQRACTSPIAPEAQALLRCLGITQTVPEIEACIAEAKHLQAAALSLLLDKAAANTERLRAHLLAQQAAGEPLVALPPTPDLEPLRRGAVALESLPQSPGTQTLMLLGIKTAHCAYAVHTHAGDGSPIAGGFALRTTCDLDNNGIPVHFSATATTPTHRITPAGAL